MLITQQCPVQRRTHVGLVQTAENKIALVVTDLNTGRESVIANVYEKKCDSKVYLSLVRLQPGVEDFISVEEGRRCVETFRQNC